MEKRHQNTRFSVRALILVLMLLRDLNENFWRGGHTWSFELSLLNTKDSLCTSLWLNTPSKKFFSSQSKLVQWKRKRLPLAGTKYYYASVTWSKFILGSKADHEGNLKQKKWIIYPWISMQFLLFYAPQLWGQVGILITRNWPVAGPY